MMEKIILPNSILLGETRELLSEGRQVIIPTKGSSMLPFIHGEKDSVLLEKVDGLAAGDIVLALIDGKRYVLHRIWEIDGDNVTLMGDGNLAGKERCTKADVCGTVSEIIKKNGKKIDVSSAGFRRSSRIWRRLLPVRRYILAVYRRII